MNQRDDAQSAGVGLDDIRQAAQGQPVDHHARVVRQIGQRAVERLPGQLVRHRKTPGQPHDLDLPATLTQAIDDKRVIAIAPSTLTRVAGDDEAAAWRSLIAHKRPS